MKTIKVWISGQKIWNLNFESNFERFHFVFRQNLYQKSVNRNLLIVVILIIVTLTSFRLTTLRAMIKRSLFQSFLAEKCQVRWTEKTCVESALSVQHLEELRCKNPDKSFDEIVATIHNTVECEQTGYEVVTWKTFCKGWQRKAQVYYEFEILRLANTH